jgi:hypothetical protein
MSPLHPFSIELDLLDRMLNFEIADDPHYSGLEIQAFADPDHGTGILVFFNRTSDGRTDVYLEAGLKVDPANYGVGNGLGEWVTTEFDIARLEVDATGVAAEICLTDAAGRLIEVSAEDRTPQGRRTAAFLAPMGAAIAAPVSLPLIWMTKFDLLRRSGTPPVVRIDGRPAQLGRLPAEWLIRRRLIKVTSDLCAVSLNPVPEKPVRLFDHQAGGETVPGDTGTRAIAATAGGHQVRFELDPEFPDLRSLGRRAPDQGGWSVTIDGNPVVAGTWHLDSSGEEMTVALDVTEGWKPQGLPLLMRIVTRVAPVFREWPTTYRWRARIRGTDQPVMTSSWERTGSERGESYRSFTKSD